jgi:uroporphyrinogen-III synthase
MLRSDGIADPFVPTSATGLVLARELPIDDGDHVLLPRGDSADVDLPAALRDRGAHVEELLAYRTVEAPAGSHELLSRAFDDGPIDVLVLTSGSSARGLLALADDEPRARLRRTPVVAIGQPTAEVAREAGYDTVLVSPVSSITALAAFTAASLGIAAAHARPGGSA